VLLNLTPKSFGLSVKFESHNNDICRTPFDMPSGARLFFVAILVFLSFYFAFMSFDTIDEAQKKEFVLLAASSVVSSVILLACLAIYCIIKKAFSRTDVLIFDIEELDGTDEI